MDSVVSLTWERRRVGVCMCLCQCECGRVGVCMCLCQCEYTPQVRVERYQNRPGTVMCAHARANMCGCLYVCTNVSRLVGVGYKDAELKRELVGRIGGDLEHRLQLLELYAESERERESERAREREPPPSGAIRRSTMQLRKATSRWSSCSWRT